MSLFQGTHDTADENLCKLLRAIQDVASHSVGRTKPHGGAESASSRRRPPEIPHPGNVIRGTWVLSERVGQGGFGLVFSAYHRTLNRVDAVKFLHPHLSHDPELRMRFTREAMVMAKLRGDHLVQVYDCDEHRGLPFFAMEYLRGRSLQEIVTENQPIPLSRFHALASGILHGLAEIHAHGIVHRDIKPANIFVVEQTERVKMLDFGLAKSSMRLTSRHAIMGTLRYMAPELLFSPDTEASVATDVYSAGVVLYQMLTGHVPYEAARDGSISDFIRVLSGPPRSPRVARPSMPASLQDLVLRAIDRKPSRRPESARAFAEAFDRAMAGVVGSRASQRQCASTVRSARVVPVPPAPCSVRSFVALPSWQAGTPRGRAGRARIAYATEAGMRFSARDAALATGTQPVHGSGSGSSYPTQMHQLGRRGRRHARFLALALVMLPISAVVPVMTEPRISEASTTRALEATLHGESPVDPPVIDEMPGPTGGEIHESKTTSCSRNGGGVKGSGPTWQAIELPRYASP